MSVQNRGIKPQKDTKKEVNPNKIKPIIHKVMKGCLSFLNCTKNTAAPPKQNIPKKRKIV